MQSLGLLDSLSRLWNRGTADWWQQVHAVMLKTTSTARLQNFPQEQGSQSELQIHLTCSAVGLHTPWAGVM